MEYEVDALNRVDSSANETDQVVELPIKTARSLSHTYLEDLSGDDIYETEAAIRDLSSLVHRVLNQKVKQGDADDWHNFAVDIARRDLFDLACEILEGGLQAFPKNADLLADYLEYGISCGRIDRCKEYYKTLLKIPKIRWNWREYSFLIDYLSYLWERSDSEKELLKLQNEMLDLANEFRSNFPKGEESYRCEAEVFKLINDKESEEKVLRLALNEQTIAPKCALRLADLLFDRGDYEDALKQIQRALHDATQTQRCVNEGYLYCLSGLSKMALAMRDENAITEDAVLEIYSDFDISLQQNHKSSYVDTIRSKTIILVAKSGIPVPDSLEELSYVVQK